MSVVGPELPGIAGFGRRLFQARSQMGIDGGKPVSKVEVSVRVAVSDTVVGQWERAQSTPSAETIEDWAAFLGVRAGWLAVGERPRYPHGDVAEPIEGVSQRSGVSAVYAAEKELRMVSEPAPTPQQVVGAGPIDLASVARDPLRRPAASK